MDANRLLATIKARIKSNQGAALDTHTFSEHDQRLADLVGDEPKPMAPQNTTAGSVQPAACPL